MVSNYCALWKFNQFFHEVIYSNIVFQFNNYFILFTISKMQQSDHWQDAQSYHSLLSELRECSNKHTATYICSSEGCSNNALMCNNKQCVYSKAKHHQCYTKLPIENFVKIVQGQKRQTPPILKNKFSNVIKQYDLIIEKLSEERVQFIKFISMFGLNQQAIQIICLIDQNKSDEINGELVHGAVKIIKQTATIYSPLKIVHKQMIKKSQAEIQMLLSSIADKLAQPALKLEMVKKKFSEDKQEHPQLDCRDNNWEIIPFEISNFVFLEELDLSHNKFSKINHLDKLQKLQVLYMRDNNIERIQNLETLVNLRGLFLRSNLIQKIQGLDSLINLVELELGDNQIQIIEGLDNLTQIQSLDLGINQISKLQNISQLVKLKKLYIYENPLVDLEPEKLKIEELRSRQIQVYSKGWRNSN